MDFVGILKSANWIDESEFNLLFSHVIWFVLRYENITFDVRYQPSNPKDSRQRFTVPVVKHGGGSVMLLGFSLFFSHNGTGPLVQMKKL